MADLDPTALQLYRQAAEDRRRLMQQQVQARHDQAWEVARLAASLLRSEFQVARIVAFGSLTQESLFHLRSDVDLAVWGLDERNYFRAVGRLQSLDPDIGVDLILFEDAGPALLTVIQRDGIEL
jgi:predicted nucleotidyltransferase